jgi:hypothetical protein
MFVKTCIAAAVSAAMWATSASAGIVIEEIGRYETGVFGESAAEIVAHDPATQRVFVINARNNTVDVLDINDPTRPTLAGTIDVAEDIPDSGGVNSVAVNNGLVAVAVENQDRQANGWAAFYTIDGVYINHVEAGALPDSIVITKDGDFALTANEGEPSADYSIDPEGSITVIDLRGGAASATTKTADFTAFNDNPPEGVRISGPNATVAQDLEPEFIAISANDRTAFVTLQENNAVAVVRIERALVETIIPLGQKDHSIEGNGLDASNRDDGINIQPWPVLGTYMPDSIAWLKTNGMRVLITANEGDAREYIYETDQATCEAAGHTFDDGDCISWLDEVRVADVTLDETAFPNAAELQDDANLGRIKILATEGDTDGDGDYDELHTYGSRSITIWNLDGSVAADTGDDMEQVVAMALPDYFNSTNDENDSFDDRSDDKGPEPEGVAVGRVGGRWYAFVGLERVGGIMAFDVNDPTKPEFVSYVNNRDFSASQEDLENGLAGDLGPEGILFVQPPDSPVRGRRPLLIVGSEVSGTTTLYRVMPAPVEPGNSGN